MAENETDEQRRQRLRFRSWHRGTRELDLLLGSFADANLAGFSKEQVDQFEALLIEQDPDLYDWIIHHESKVPAMHDNDVMQKLRAHRFQA
jgi:antitoxin CptB